MAAIHSHSFYAPGAAGEEKSVPLLDCAGPYRGIMPLKRRMGRAGVEEKRVPLLDYLTV